MCDPVITPLIVGAALAGGQEVRQRKRTKRVAEETEERAAVASALEGRGDRARKRAASARLRAGGGFGLSATQKSGSLGVVGPSKNMLGG